MHTVINSCALYFTPTRKKERRGAVESIRQLTAECIEIETVVVLLMVVKVVAIVTR